MSLQQVSWSKLLSMRNALKTVVKVVHRRLVTNTPCHKILVSSSTDIFENLALEDWLYEKADLEHESVLLLWRNSSAIVIGRHQNPWVECNIPECIKQKVDIARRKSGGGTVYHDEGNLNCSFIKRRELYNRKENLEFVIGALKSRWNVDLSLNSREDIVLDGQYKSWDNNRLKTTQGSHRLEKYLNLEGFLEKFLKIKAAYSISGTASKLGGKRTYHHFTLLYDVDTDKLNRLLHSNMEGVTSNATKSTRMAVRNLKEQATDMDFHSLVDVISSHFVENHQNSSLETINPAAMTKFLGIENHSKELESWEWIYGKTPSFSIERQFSVDLNNSHNIADLHVNIRKGLVHNLQVKILRTENIHPLCIKSLETGLEGTRLCNKRVTSQLSQIKLDWISKNYYTVQSQQVLDWCLLCVIQLLGL